MRRAVLAVFTAAALIAPTGARAQSTPSAAEIIERLKGAPEPQAQPRGGARTRGLSGAPASVPVPPPSRPGEAVAAPGSAAAPATVAPADRDTVDKLFARQPRGLSSGDRQAAASISRARPAIDITIYFDFNSAEIGPKAVPALVELGQALGSPDLAGRRFLLAGHTDAKGGNDYNQALSERRAAAIKSFLTRQFRIDEARLLAIGFGEEQLKNRADPNASENRRVQIVNLGN